MKSALGFSGLVPTADGMQLGDRRRMGSSAERCSLLVWKQDLCN